MYIYIYNIYSYIMYIRLVVVSEHASTRIGTYIYDAAPASLSQGGSLKARVIPHSGLRRDCTPFLTTFPLTYQ